MKVIRSERMIPMKKLLALALSAALLLTGCGSPKETTPSEPAPETTVPEVTEVYKDITGPVVDIRLEGQNITVTGEAEGVYTSRDIVYYENKTEYESGNPYGEGEEWEMHSREEAESHLVVNITAPGTYRITGKLDQGQIRVDLGEEAASDPNAVVNLILDNAEITCTVAPAILFRNVYECDGNWSVETAKPDVDTAAAGANLILAENSRNILHGSHVAKVFKDKEGEKKLVKQDGALYSYMSLNIYGPGALDIHADNEGLDTELHLSIWSGDITIRSGNDGINTNEDGVSVTAIHGGTLRILAGLGEEGDGIDSNGYLVIYGGTVISSAHPASDAGLDSDLGSFIHGGTVVAMGSPMDWAESDSGQVTMNLQFAENQTGEIAILQEDGSHIFSFDPAKDPLLCENQRGYRGLILSCAQFRLGDVYLVYAGGIQMAYTGTDVMSGPGGFIPGEGGQWPEGGIDIPGDWEDMPHPPEGDFTLPPPPSEGMDPVPQGTPPTGPQGTPPSGPMDTPPQGQNPPTGTDGEPNIHFKIQDKVNFFSGLTPVS